MPCQGCYRATGLGTITMTNPNYQVYNGLNLTLTKRFSNRWQMNGSLTVQDNPQHTPYGPGVESTITNPTGLEFTNGNSTIPRYLIKLSGSYALPWNINAAGNLIINDGNTRTVSITGPGNVYAGVDSNGAATTQNLTTLTFQPNNATRFGPAKLLDLGVNKSFNFNGGKNRLKLSLDAFNVFNINTITSYSSNTISNANFNSPTNIVPPRVFRVGAQIAF